MTGSSNLHSCVVRFTAVFIRMDIRDGVLLTMSIVSFFSTNKDQEAVDSEVEEKESKDNESDEEATDKSQKPNSLCYEKKFNTRCSNDYGWLKHDSGKPVMNKTTNATF